MLVKETLDEMVESGQVDAVERYVEAFMGAAAGKGWAKKDGQIVIPPLTECVARIVVAIKPPLN